MANTIGGMMNCQISKKGAVLLFLGILFSPHAITQWIKTTGPFGPPSVSAFAVNGTTLFVGLPYTGVASSTDYGMTWKVSSTGLVDIDVTCLATDGRHLYTGSDLGVSLSSDCGSTWTPVCTGLPRTPTIRALATLDTLVFTADDYGKIYRSTDNGSGWTLVDSGNAYSFVTAFAELGDTILAGGDAAGIIRSVDHGVNWTRSDAGITNSNVDAIVVKGESLFAATATGVFCSTDHGTSWKTANSGQTLPHVLSLAASGTRIFGGTEGSGVYMSSDNGSNWGAVNGGVLQNAFIIQIVAIGTSLFAATDGAVYRSTDNGTSWVQVDLLAADVTVQSFATDSQFLFAGTSAGVFRTSDEGASWTLVESGMPRFQEVFSLAVAGDNLFAATSNRTIFRSTNDGLSWTDIGSPAGKTKLATYGTNLYAGGYGIFRSTDYGTSWTGAGSGFPGEVMALGCSDPYIFAGTWGWGAFRSTDYGTNWSQITFGPQDASFDCIATVGSAVFMGTRGNYLYYSSDNGATWDLRYSGLTNIGPDRPEIVSLASCGIDIFAGLPFGVFVSTNGGQRWSMWNSGLEAVYQNSSFIQALVSEHGYVFAAVGNRGVWRRPLSEVETGVRLSNDLPTVISLGQNFPNPFNPTTTIRFALPTRAHVTLSVFNTIGQAVATLVNEVLEAGYHETVFDGGNLASGVYFYRLRAGDYVQTKKLALVR